MDAHDYWVLFRDANKIYRVRDHPIMTLDEDQNIFLVTSVIPNL